MKMFQFIKSGKAGSGDEMKFKTNIKCGGCIATVKPHLDKATGIESWDVDIQSPQKVLKIKSSGISSEEVIAIVKGAGYQIEKI
jgi:copper chaperone